MFLKRSTPSYFVPSYIHLVVYLRVHNHEENKAAPRGRMHYAHFAKTCFQSHIHLHLRYLG